MQAIRVETSSLSFGPRYTRRERVALGDIPTRSRAEVASAIAGVVSDFSEGKATSGRLYISFQVCT